MPKTDLKNFVIVKTFAETLEQVKKGNFAYSYRPESIEDLCPHGPRILACKGEPASLTKEFMMRDFLPVFDKEKCTQCGTCWIFCPLAVVYEDDDGYFDVDTEFCRACGVCAHECPAGAITMERIKQ